MFMPSSAMLHSLKPFQCPTCNYSFTGRDAARVHSVTRFPLILKCGHTVCESCVKSAFRTHRKIQCSICQKITDFGDGGENSVSKLLPDIYVLGIVSANLKQALPSLKMKLIPASPTLADKRRNDGTPVVICEHCSRNEASYRCEKCEEDFCNTCFDSYHNSRRNLKKHMGMPIYAYRYNSMVQEGCVEHDRAIEFYCEEDNELTCSHCVVTGKHKGHAVLTLLEKNKACAGDLKKIHDETVAINRRLRFTEQKLAQAIPNEKVDNSQWIKEVHDHFHSQHTALIIRESELLSQIEEISNGSVSQLEKMRQEVSDSFKDLEAILRDAELAIENPTLSVSAPAIIKKLQYAKSLPCHLIPVQYDEETSKPLNISFDPALLDAVSKHGKVTADIKPKFYLRSSNELPEDFIVEPLPAEPPVVTDSESLASDFSEDSLNHITSPVPSSSAAIPLRFEKFTTKQEKVIACHIRNPNSFWVMRSSDSHKLKQMADQIKLWVKTADAAKHVPKKVKQGDLYLVRYSVDNKWYRGRVKQILEDDSPTAELEELGEQSESDNSLSIKKVEQGSPKVLVYYVDYGNTESTSIGRMRNIQAQFLNLPGMAKQCSLFNICPITGNMWTEEAIKTFGNFVRDREVNMQVFEERNNVLYVDLSQAAAIDIMNDVPVSVRDALVFLEHGCFICERKTPIGKVTRGLRQFLPPEQLRASSRASINISHIESPSLFHVQQLSTSRHLSDLIIDMQKVYTDETNILHAIYVPYIGMICAAQFQKDGLWYRAEVIKLPGGATVEVEFVDFGYREVLHHRYLRKILDRFTKLNKQAIPCTLADVTFNQGTRWPPEAKEWLTSYTAQKRFTVLSLGMLPGDKRIKAVLYDPQDDTEVCINAVMVQAGIAVSNGPYSTVPTKPRSPPKQMSFVPASALHSPSKSAVLDVNEEDEEEAQQPMSLVPAPAVPPKPEDSLKPKEEPEDYVKVHVSHIETPGIFYIRIAGEVENRLKELMRRMQEFYKDLENTPDVSEGLTCATYLESEKTWYRAILLGNIKNERADVRCVDYGYTPNVPLKNLRTLPPQFGEDKSFAVKSHLAGVLPAGGSDKWPQVAVNTFKELIAHHDVLYLICAGDVDGRRSLPADLLYKEIVRGGALEPSTLCYKSIVQKLIESGVALPERRIRKDNFVKLEQPQVPPLTPTESPTPSIPEPKAPEPEESDEAAEQVEETEKSSEIIPPPTVRVPNFQWKPAKFPAKSEFVALVTHIDHDGCIHLQLKPEGTKNADLIKKALQCKYASFTNFEEVRIPPAVGEACVAKFVIDEKWYRAEVVDSVKSPNKVKVQFVDYGNFEIVNLSDILLDTPMKEFPRQCVECELHDIVPIPGPQLNNALLDFLHEMLVEQFCDVELMIPPQPGKRLQVALTVQESNVNVNSLLIDMGSAVSVEKYQQIVAIGEASLAANECVQETKIVNCYKEASPLRFREPFPVCITQMLEPTVVCLQRLKVPNPVSEEDVATNEEFSEFLQLVEDLNSKAENFPPVAIPEIGLACSAQYTFDNAWYRCKITEINGQEISVLYVDYGNSEILPLERLRLPESHFLAFPVQAHICKISGMEPVGNEWTTGAAELLVKKLCHSGMDIYAKVVCESDIYEIELLLRNEEGEFELAYKELVDANLVTIDIR